jgi:hypothetical protein
MSMFPRVIFNVEQSSVRRGLARTVHAFKFRFKLRRRSVAGTQMPSSAASQHYWSKRMVYGIVCGFDVAKPTMVMASCMHDRE